MTLHEAIARVLTGGNCLTPSEIAVEINRLQLYSRNDGRPVPASQISARVRNYADLFERNEGTIRLRGARTAAPVGRPGAAPLGPRPESPATAPGGLIFHDLGTVGNLIDKGFSRISWLEHCGIYLLKLPANFSPRFIHPNDALAAGNVITPWPVEKLQSKWVANTDTVYIGLAGRRAPRSLRKRLTDLVRHAAGKTSDRGPHSGGEIVWQLEGYREINVWAAATGDPPVPRNVEAAMIGAFEREHRAMPFANRQR